MESTIKWKTGVPEETGDYLVQMKNHEMIFDVNFWSNLSNSWLFDDALVVAWCKLSDIKPYMEDPE